VRIQQGRLFPGVLLAALSLLAGAVAAGCGGPAAAPRARARALTAARFASVRAQVAAGNGAAPFQVARSARLPAGWTVEVWARVPGARFEAWSPEGDLLVSVPSTGDVVELLPRRDRALAPASRVLLSGLTEPQGMAFDKVGGRELLYVAESDQVDRYVWSSAGPSARTVIVKGLPDLSPPGDDEHRVKTLAVAPDHRVYVEVGSSSNVDTADLTTRPPRASILSFEPDGSHLRVFATGVRNAEGLAFAPDGTLWAAVNERDNDPYPFHRAYGGYSDAFDKVIQSYVNDNPPDEVARMTSGRNLGWPYCDPDAQVSPGSAGSKLDLMHLRFEPDAYMNPDGKLFDCAKVAPPELGLPAHSAPLGMTFLEGSKLPTRWTSGAVVAVHGSWNRTPPQPPAVLWLPWDAATHRLGAPITLVSGFQLADGSRWGRPVDAVPGPDGALYVSDDTAGAVYRLVP
jgi:glucose/arabinose dehydrogenase